MTVSANPELDLGKDDAALILRADGSFELRIPSLDARHDDDPVPMNVMLVTAFANAMLNHNNIVEHLLDLFEADAPKEE